MDREMTDTRKSKQQLQEEVSQLRQRIADLEAVKKEDQQENDSLRESEQKYTKLLEMSTSAVYSVDLEGYVTYFTTSHWHHWTGRPISARKKIGTDELLSDISETLKNL